MRPAFRFKSPWQDSVNFKGRLNGKAIERVFGYLIKNMGTRFEITLDDKAVSRRGSCPSHDAIGQAGLFCWGAGFRRRFRAANKFDSHPLVWFLR